MTGKLYGQGGRRPFASINLVTTHESFTLNELGRGAAARAGRPTPAPGAG